MWILNIRNLFRLFDPQINMLAKESFQEIFGNIVLINYCSTNMFSHKSPWTVCQFKKLDRVGPVENRPSIDQLHHFVKKNKE